jgi:branched-subunit amino acid transport protein
MGGVVRFSKRRSRAPALPLSFLTVSCLAFLSAGLVAGSFTLLRTSRWLRVIGVPIVAGIVALAVCGMTRSALLAVPVGFVLSLGLEMKR